MKAIAFAGLSVLLAACQVQTQDAAKNAPAKTSTTTQNPRATVDRGTTANPVGSAAGNVVPIAPPTARVALTEYTIDIPATMPSGPATLTVVNSGVEDHGLVIEGNGAQQKLPEPLKRGDSATLNIDLKPGTYTVYCPVDKHRGKGMSKQISVR